MQAQFIEQVTLKWDDVMQATEPIVLERDGQPIAVVLRYSDYQRLGGAEVTRRDFFGQALENLLAEVHAGTQQFTDAEIEADITAALQEVRAAAQVA